MWDSERCCERLTWTVCVGRYLSPAALYFSREVRPQGTDLWIQWENCVGSFEKQHRSTCTDLESVKISNMMQPDLMSIMTLKRILTLLKDTLKCPEPVDDIGWHSSTAALWIHFLCCCCCCCSCMMEDCLHYLNQPGSWKSILMHSLLSVHNHFISYTCEKTKPLKKKTKLWHKQVEGRLCHQTQKRIHKHK